MDELLAKPDVPLITHLADVTRVGHALAHRFGLPEHLRVKTVLACAFHDVGKATSDFQEYIRGKRKRAYPHALASLPFVLVAETSLAQRYGWAVTRLEATAAVLTHHSPLRPELYQGYGVPDFHLKLVEALESVWELLRRVGVDGLPPAKEFFDSMQLLLRESPAALLHDRSRSLRGIFQSLPPQEFAQVKAVLHLADWLVSATKPDHQLLFLGHGRTRIEEHIRRFSLREFQRQTASASCDVLHLRAPTGSGKTEALLLWAGDAERLIYLLPTQATVNAMWKRLRKIYGEDSVALAHGRASYILHKESDEDPLDMRLFGSVFAKPVTVATLDQYLLAHLNGRHWEERRSLSKRATIILDEIHAYEPYTLGLLLEALERERPARLALASATLPPALLKLFPEGTPIEAEVPFWQRTRHRLELRDGTLPSSLPDAVAYAREGKTVLIVANTVRDAQALYQALRNEIGWERRYLLHARFIFRDRQHKEAQVENPRPGTIFIATQVVEVSLDISYDVLMTEVAPLDALVQRMGRVNRYGKKPTAPTIVYCRWSEGSQRVYGKELVELSLELLNGLPSTPTDRDLAEAVANLYQCVIPTPDWQEELQAGRQTLHEIQRILGCYTIDLSDEEMRSRFTARRGHVSVEVLPAELVQEAYQLRERDEVWRLPELLVPVPAYWLTRSEFFTPLEDLGCIQTTLEYNSEQGLMPYHQGQEVPTYAFID